MRKERNQNRKRNWKKWILPLLAGTFLLLGAVVFFYPVVSNYLAEQNHQEMITAHAQAVEQASSEEIQKQWEEAIAYNENLAGDPVHDPFVWGSGYVLPDNYEDVLNLDEVMCTLEIPKIDLSLPVYHGTSEEVLERGVGHLETTALPIGGENRHSVLTGHRGLPSAELFTRLDELEIGDMFYIHVLDEVHAYEVDSIQTVEPDELEMLVPEEGKDLITLVTCTPYAVNSHRLLVRGTRVPYEEEKVEQEVIVNDTEEASPILWFYIIGIGIGAVIVGIVIWFLFRRKRGRHER